MNIYYRFKGNLNWEIMSNEKLKSVDWVNLGLYEFEHVELKYNEKIYTGMTEELRTILHKAVSWEKLQGKL